MASNNNVDANVKIKISTEVDKSGLDELTNQIADTGAAEDALGKVSDAVDDVGAAFDKAGDQAAAASKKATSNMTNATAKVGAFRGAIDAMTKSWDAFATAAGKFFGVIGLIQQIIGAVQMVYDLLTKAEREREEAAKRAAEEEKRLAEQILKDAATETIKERQKSQLDAIYTHYKDITDELRRQLELTQRRLDLEQGIDDQESEQQRLIARAAHARGELTDDQLAQRLDEIDLSANARRRARREQQAQEQLDAAVSNEAAAQAAHEQAEAAREQARDPRIMSAEEYAASLDRIHQIGQKMDEEKEYYDSLNLVEKSGWSDEYNKRLNNLRQETQEVYERLQPTLDALKEQNPSLNAKSAEEVVQAIQNYETSMQGLDKVVDDTQQQLTKASQTVAEFTRRLTDLQTLNKAQAETDRQRGETNAAVRTRAATDRAAADAERKAQEEARELEKRIRDAQKAVDDATKKVRNPLIPQDDANAMQSHLAGVSDAQMRAAQQAAYGRVQDTLKGGVTAQEYQTLQQMLATYQEGRGGDAEGRTIMINLLTGILGQMQAAGQERQAYLQQLNALQQRFNQLSNRSKLQMTGGAKQIF